MKSRGWIAAVFLLAGAQSCAHPLSIPESGWRAALRPAIVGNVLDVEVRDPRTGNKHLVTLRVSAVTEEFIEGVVRREYVQLSGPVTMEARIALPRDRRRRIDFEDVESIAVLDVRAEDFAGLCRGGRFTC